MEFVSAGDTLAQRLADRSAKAGIIGLGYVGLPLARAAAKAGFTTIGFDIDAAKVDLLNAGKSYIDAVSSEDLLAHVNSGQFTASSDFEDRKSVV